MANVDLGDGDNWSSGFGRPYLSDKEAAKILAEARIQKKIAKAKAATAKAKAATLKTKTSGLQGRGGPLGGGRIGGDFQDQVK